MVFFITFLRALAACLITNSHYTGIYPTDLIANGGLIGDIIFFAVSGYCLYNVKANFVKWYSKRIVRCYLPVIIITICYMLLGFYSLSDTQSVMWWYVYPTAYHFVASIVVLYIPYYIIMKFEALKKRISLIMLITLAIGLLIYLSPLYDKSYYHVDTVREPFIRFLYMESMLLGAYFKQNEKKFTRARITDIIGMCCFLVLYFVSKITFSKINALSNFQIVNWFTIFALLYFVLKFFSGMEQKLKLIPKPLKSIISYISSITLEIYVVQSVIISAVRPYFSFPLNWGAVTASILITATALHFVCKYILVGTDFLKSKVKMKTEVKE